MLCAVMLRGRHRGLPTSLDRAILLPHEFDKKEKNTHVDNADTRAVEVLRSPTLNVVEESQESDEHVQEKTIEES